jgi:His-Xaa-Ser system protein HxsD
MAGEIVVDFATITQSQSALDTAAYRLLGIATCQIDKSGDRYLCRLHPTANIDPETLRARFIALVTDENVRENLRAKTEPVRNLILSLAFGSLAENSTK